MGSENITPEAEAPFKGRPLVVDNQHFLTDLPDDVEPFTSDAVTV